MVDVTGSNDIGGTNQTGDNNFGDFGFWFEWVEFADATNLTEAGFDVSDGSIAAGTTVYNAGGTNDLDGLASNASAITLGNDTTGDISHYGIRATTTLTVTNDGTYTFDVRSDDGVIIYVDGVEVVNDDSLHAPRNRQGDIDLTAGQHEVVIIYFERTGQNVLEVDIQSDAGGDYPAAIPLQDANVQANAAADTITSNGGDDTIDAGDGDDDINVTGGSNDVDGGAGDDTIFITGATETNTVMGGDGDDTITVFNAAGSVNTIDGGADNDTIQTGDSTDIISGGDGDDSLNAGAGDDTLDGGDGNDTLVGFDGDDTYTGGDGFDTFDVSQGVDVITDFNTGTGQNINDDDQTNNDFINLEPYYDNLSELRADLDDDGLLNQSNATDTKGRAVDYTDNTAFGAGNTTALTGVASADLTFDNTNVVCFTPGTMIETETGQVDVADLRIGDAVLTMDHGLQPIRWIGVKTLDRATLDAEPKLRPIKIKAGALGRNLPEDDLVVSPQHRILLQSKIAKRIFDTHEVLVPAKKMTALDGIDICADCDNVSYIHIMFDQHELIFANGALAESLLLGPQAVKAIPQDAREEILRLFPELMDPEYLPMPVRTIPTRGHKVRSLIDRHYANAQPVLQIPPAVRH